LSKHRPADEHLPVAREQESPAPQNKIPGSERQRAAQSSRLQSFLIPLLAIVTALIISGFLILVSDIAVINAFTHIPRLVAVPFTDPTTQISLQEALWYHPPQVIVGDTVEVNGQQLQVVSRVEKPEEQIALDEARRLYPNLGPGVTIYLNFFRKPQVGLQTAWKVVSTAYAALFEGAIGNPRAMVAAIQAWIGGNSSLLLEAFYPLSESLVRTTPYILTGLAVALGFHAGVFNVGAEGQYFIGGLLAVLVGYSIKGLPIYIHLPLMLLAGIVGGGLWGAIPGLLKATTGAHEVINTIMMNYLAFSLSDWLLNGPMKRPGGFRPITPEIQPSAMLPSFFPSPIRFHAGFFLALACAGAVFWLLYKTTLGFELRTVGANMRAARYAGISLTRTFILAMFFSGGLAGLAAANEISGVIHFMPNAFSAGYGFDSIALALLGRSHPFGVVLAALLFGTLRSGAARMQSVAQIPIDIISILQALIIIFIAAPEIIRWLYHIRLERELGATPLTRGWKA
jgi:general nucleoside transport system permease protein